MADEKTNSLKANERGDGLVAALSYFPLFPFNIIFCIINLLSTRTYVRFHGAQGFVYWIIIGILSVPALFAGSLGFMGYFGVGGAIAWFTSTIFFLGFWIIYPIQAMRAVYKLQDAVLPYVGPVIAEKTGFKTTVESKPSKDNTTEVVYTVGYFPGIFVLIAVIGLIIGFMKNNARTKFHAVQAIVYWALINGIFIGLSIVSPDNNVRFVVLIGFIIFSWIAPLAIAYRNYHGKEFIIPILGLTIAKLTGYSPK